MSVEQHTEINIEAHEIHAALEPVLDSLTVPVRYVVASGAEGGKELAESASWLHERGPRCHS
jgi:hypothetical protein